MRTVVKIGGSCLSYPDLLRKTCSMINKRENVIVVPGGGIFAEIVRKKTRELEIDDVTAHWMAILAMNQFGYLISSWMDNSELSNNPMIEAKGPVVWLPYEKMVEDNPLPCNWSVTSDSIAAWLAIDTGTRSFVKITAFPGNIPSIIRNDSPWLRKTKLLDPFLLGYLRDHDLECHVLLLNDPEGIKSYFQENANPRAIIKA
ncbi:MAG: amino acid kinase family protein [Candidatus Hodarchaeales archaeon]